MEVSKFPIRRLFAVFVSILLLALVFWSSGVENVLRGLAGFPPWAVASMLALLLANLVLVSFRFWRVLAHFGIALPWDIALRASIAGNVAGLIVIPLFGQIMGRQSVLHSFGVQPVVNASLAAYERALLAFVSGVLGTLGGFYLLGQSAVSGFFEQIALAEIVIAACGGWALSLWLGRSRFEKKLSGRVFSRANLARVMLIAGLTLAGQLMMLGCFMVGILAVSQAIPIASLFAASAIISLAASMPITVNGWGVREGTAVYVLGILGVPAADALTMSVMVGLCSTLVILASAPFCLRKLSDAHV
ncbi:MAG: lysylphosphatidylglycerol synthase transmembrane domain-containing protein [Nitrospira sp.]